MFAFERFSGLNIPSFFARALPGLIVLVAASIATGLVAAEPPAADKADDAERGTTPKLLVGKLVDAAGKPLARAKLTPIARKGQLFSDFQPVESDDAGHFELNTGQDGLYQFGHASSIKVVTAGGLSYEVNVVVAKGVNEVRVPTLIDSPVRGPEKVAANDLAGVVVDSSGAPLAGVEVHAWDWYPTHRTKTDENGAFRLKGVGEDKQVEVRFRKQGYSPETFIQQPTGVANWLVVLGSATYLEGTVTGADGAPAAGARIRANQGPRYATGVLIRVISTIWTETYADDAGKYRLYLQPDEYELLVTSDTQGVAQLKEEAVGRGVHTRDIKLDPGVAFRATVVDSETGEPVPNVRLWHWQHPDIEGRSTPEGLVLIRSMLPGVFEFDVDAKGYTRWWSDDCKSEWCRRQIDKPKLQWQRNFDHLDFDLRTDMAPVKVVVEKGVHILGRVVDPNGAPVKGATVAPALTGTGNCLTGDTRFSVATKQDGTFDMLLPASHEARYNLVAHDGKFGQWRKWANGVLPPIQTKPGEELTGVELQLTRPATVRGRVVDRKGKLVAGVDVRAQAVDKLENHLYDPTTKTKKDGTFELKFVRPGDQYIQTEPMFLIAEEGPKGASKRMVLTEGQEVDDVELISGHDQNEIIFEGQ